MPTDDRAPQSHPRAAPSKLRAAAEAAVLVAALLVAACQTRGCAGCGAGPKDSATSARAPSLPSPLSVDALPTHGAPVAMSFLENAVKQAQAKLGAPDVAVHELHVAARAYLDRSLVLGRLGDLDIAEAIADRAVRSGKTDPEAYLLHAEVRLREARFLEAIRDLDHAAELHGDAFEVEARRADALQGAGRYEEARPLRERQAKDRQELSTVAALASLLSAEGKLDEAEPLYVEAQHHYSDASPIPLVSMWVEQARMWQQAGNNARARQLLVGALERLPDFAPAAGLYATVLAATGARDEAVTRLRALVAKSDNPEYATDLAALLAAAPGSPDAEDMRQRALVRYSALVARHPEAFVYGAARARLAPSTSATDGKEALALAERDLANRKTADTYRLVVESALLAGNASRACEAVASSLVLAPKSRPAHELAAKAYAACGDEPRAAGERQAAEALGRGP